MKKVLFATTALIASAGFAAAEVSVGGSANMGLKWDDANNEADLHYELDFDLIGSGETDTGLTFGASLDVDTPLGATIVDPGADTVYGTTDDAVFGNSAVGDGEVFIGGAFGTVTVGAVDVATDGFGIADLGFDGLGVDDDAELTKYAGNGSNGTPLDPRDDFASSANVHYAFASGPIGVIATYDTNTYDYSGAVTFDGGDFSGGIGYTKDVSADSSAVTLGAGATFGDISANGFYSQAKYTGLDVASYGIDVSFDAGLVVVTGAYGDTDLTNDDADYGVGFAYDLGGGATLAGGVASVDDTAKADLGINMSF